MSKLNVGMLQSPFSTTCIAHSCPVTPRSPLGTGKGVSEAVPGDRTGLTVYVKISLQ